ncbi:hypothetical protein LDI10_04485 [Lactobacillus delbrueckii subsp. indicus]|nr:hypothetical protein LDI10_04485 [Lactobacillus delbrueckii subsp. indicus]
MLSVIMIFYIHQNLQYLISTMSFLHTILLKQYFSKSLRPAIIKHQENPTSRKEIINMKLLILAANGQIARIVEERI